METDVRDLIGYHVVDGREEDVGSVCDVWTDPETGEPEFVGVDIGVFHRTHLIPLRGAHIDHDAKSIRVNFFHDTIRNTRHVAKGQEITSQDRWELYREYNLDPPAPGAPSPYHAEVQAKGVPASDSDMDTPASGL